MTHFVAGVDPDADDSQRQLYSKPIGGAGAPNASGDQTHERRPVDTMQTELHKQLAEDKQKKLVQSYEEMRTMFGQQEFRQLTFK